MPTRRPNPAALDLPARLRLAGGMNLTKADMAVSLAGLLPFVASAVAVVTASSAFPETKALWLGIVWGGLVLSFLAGIRCGAVKRPAQVMVLATGFVFSALVAMTAAAPVAIALLVAAFLLLALWSELSGDVAHGLLRLVLSSGAVLSLLVLLVASLT